MVRRINFFKRTRAQRKDESKPSLVQTKQKRKCTKRTWNQALIFGAKNEFVTATWREKLNKEQKI